MALTLGEAAKIAQNDGNVFLAGVIEHYIRENPLMAVIPFDDIAGNSVKYNREETLPGIGFRGVNGSYTESTGVINPVTESLAIAGGDLDVDKFILDTMGENHREIHEGMKIKALSLAITKTLIKGDNDSNPKEFTGLQARIQGNQLISAGTTSGGAALSLLKLDELISEVNNPTHLIMNKKMGLRMGAAQRDSSVAGYITFEQNEFGQTVMRYQNLPIVIVDTDNEGNDIMGFDEAASSGSSTATSIYCASFREDGVKGIQNGGIQARDLGELESKPAMRTRVEWYCGMMILSGKSCARLQHVGDLAVTA